MNCSVAGKYRTMLNLPICSFLAAAQAARVVGKFAPSPGVFVQCPSLARNSRVSAFSMRIFTRHNSPRALETQVKSQGQSIWGCRTESLLCLAFLRQLLGGVCD